MRLSCACYYSGRQIADGCGAHSPVAAIAILLAGVISEPHQLLNSTHGNARKHAEKTLREEPVLFPSRMAFAHIQPFLRGPVRGSSVEPASSGRQIADVCGAHSPLGGYHHSIGRSNNPSASTETSTPPESASPPR